MIALAKTDNIIGMPQKNNEWYTPARYIEAARIVLDGIDLDPASSSTANETVKALRYFTKEEDGLVQEWKARSIWLNPPYERDMTRQGPARSTIGKWVHKLIAEYQSGNVKQAIFLGTARTDASWFQLLFEYPVCFPDHKVFFDCLVRTQLWNGKASHIHGTCFVYLGMEQRKFISHFAKFGRIVHAIDTTNKQSVNLLLWEGV